LAALALSFAARPATAEFQIGVYGGVSESFDSDASLVQPNGTIHGFYWLNINPSWGLMVDYSRAKIYGDLGSTVEVSGTRDGAAMNGSDVVSNTFDILEFTDGLNEIYFGVIYHWQHERWTPYVGLGVGFAFPHPACLAVRRLQAQPRQQRRRPR
jgi:hypothetical protein